MIRTELLTASKDGYRDELDELIREATRVDGHEPIGEHKFLRLQRGNDRGAAVVAFDGDRLAGYGHMLCYGDREDLRVSVELVVHPKFRGRGTAGRLLTEAVAYAQREGSKRIYVWAYNDSPTSERIAKGLGFHAERRLLHLHRHIGTSSFQREANAPNVQVRAFRRGVDDEAWLALNARVFGDHPENGAWTIEDLHARFEQPWFNEDDFLVLEIDGDLAGYCWLKIDERGDDGRVGEIYVIGIAPEYQGRGLAHRLLARALAHIEARNTKVAAIYVDAANTRALRLYQMLGFHHHHADVCYSRELSAVEQGVERAA